MLNLRSLLCPFVGRLAAGILLRSGGSRDALHCRLESFGLTSCCAIKCEAKVRDAAEAIRIRCRQSFTKVFMQSRSSMLLTGLQVSCQAKSDFLRHVKTVEEKRIKGRFVVPVPEKPEAMAGCERTNRLVNTPFG